MGGQQPETHLFSIRYTTGLTLVPIHRDGAVCDKFMNFSG